MVFLALYTALSAAGIYLDYRAGLFVEAAYGQQMSLLFFLVVFFVVLIGAFPIAVRLTPADKS